MAKWEDSWQLPESHQNTSLEAGRLRKKKNGRRFQCGEKTRGGGAAKSRRELTHQLLEKKEKIPREIQTREEMTAQGNSNKNVVPVVKADVGKKKRRGKKSKGITGSRAIRWKRPVEGELGKKERKIPQISAFGCETDDK